MLGQRRPLAVSHPTCGHGPAGLKHTQIRAKPERRGRPAGSRAHFLQLLPQAPVTIHPAQSLGKGSPKAELATSRHQGRVIHYKKVTGCGVLLSGNRRRAGTVITMAQSRSTHKGDRAQIMARPDRIVYDIVKQEAAARGIPMGQYVADVLAAHVGHPELVRELNKKMEVLPLAM